MNTAFAYLAATAVVFVVSAPSKSSGGSLDRPVRLASSATARASVATALSGAEIQARLIGNTITGVEDGETYAEYLAPDGTISGEGDSGAYAGFWRVAGDQLCFRYDDDDAGGAWDCASVTLIGASVYWSRGAPAGAPPEATLLAGNPKKL